LRNLRQDFECERENQFECKLQYVPDLRKIIRFGFQVRLFVRLLLAEFFHSKFVMSDLWQIVQCNAKQRSEILRFIRLFKIRLSPESIPQSEPRQSWSGQNQSLTFPAVVLA